MLVNSSNIFLSYAINVPPPLSTEKSTEAAAEAAERRAGEGRGHEEPAFGFLAHPASWIPIAVHRERGVAGALCRGMS